MEKQKHIENNRVTFIDLFRTFGIVAMIMGHINFGWHFDHLIHGFHMPMFFFVSGYFFKECNDGKNLVLRLKNRSISLLIPYIIFSAFHIFISTMIQRKFSIEWIKLLLFNTSGDGIPIAGALWFLTALFFAEMLYSCIDNLVRNRVFQHIIVIIIALLGNSLGILLDFRLPLAIDVAMVGIGFFHIGRIFRKKADFFKSFMKPWISLLMMIFGFIIIMINPYVNLRWGTYGIVPLFWGGGFLSIVGLWGCCFYIDKYLQKCKFYGLFINIGKDSIVFLCLNQLVILISFYFVDKTGVGIWIKRIIVLLLVYVILEFMRIIFTKTKLKIIIGRKIKE